MAYNFVPGNVPINYILSLLSRPFVFPASPTIANKFLWKKNVFAKMKIVPNKKAEFILLCNKMLYIHQRKKKEKKIWLSSHLFAHYSLLHLYAGD